MVDLLSLVVSVVFLTLAAITIAVSVFFALRALKLPKYVAMVLIMFVSIWLETLFVRGTILFWRDKSRKHSSDP
jgi:hypothetical protein